MGALLLSALSGLIVAATYLIFGGSIFGAILVYAICGVATLLLCLLSTSMRESARRKRESRKNEGVDHAEPSA